ncbi:siderophore biosynthesis protein [Paenibacillus sp. FSL H8-0537]|uniref:siderophore biosynthesis protein n=1 Tax=Paenibacillus sp. FSL H8-0537 TaxID=2921399 RepID=UPI00310194F0
MNIPEAFIKPFPTYEDVFYDDIENHRKHFLPICSIHLKCIDPELDEWLHVVSAKEIYEGCVGDSTQSYHTLFTKEDMLGFDVIDGKYKFEADWNYFTLHQQEHSADSEIDEDLKAAYAQNELDYQIRKQFYQNNQKVYPYSRLSEEFSSAEELLADFNKKQADGWGLSYPEINGIWDDIAFMSDEAQGYLQKYNETVEELRRFENTNLLHVPKKANGEVFDYIGSITGYYFQAYGADNVFLFYDKELRKAVICFEYT